MEIFDRRAVRAHRSRAARRVHRVLPILQEASARLLDRLDDTTAAFQHALEIGGRGVVGGALSARGMTVVSMDVAPALAAIGGGVAVAGDAECLPFAPASFDLVVACLSLHWVNDLPGALIQIRRALKPGGFFLANLPVLPTLGALRHALMAAETEIYGGASPRVSPFPDLRDCAGLMQRAGFALPVADADEVLLSYATPLALLRDLQAAGESNAVGLRDKRIRGGAMFAAALARLGGNGAAMPISLHIATISGWAG